MEEQEIDLRPFILPLVARWKFILLITLVVTLLAVTRTFITAPGYTATADTLIRPLQSKPSFDARFPNQEDTSAQASSQGRQKALTSLANSELLEKQVLPQLPPNIIPENFQSGSLAKSYKVKVEGELIRISVVNKDAQDAQTLVDMWAKAYVDLVNAIYSGVVIEQVQEELSTAQTRYDEAQKTLEEFVRTNDLTALNRQMEIMSTLLSHSRGSMLEQFSKYLGRARAKEDFLLDLHDMQRQIETGQDGNLGNIMSAMQIRARFGGGGGLPVQLQLDSLDPLNGDRISIKDIETMIGIIEKERDDLIEKHLKLAKDSITGNVETIALPLALRDEYEKELRDLQMRVEKQNAQQMLLTQNRDIALGTLTTLKTKLDEQRVSQGFSENQLVLIGSTVAPPRILPSLVKNLAVGLVGGMFVAVAGVLLVDVIRPRMAALYVESRQKA